MLGDEAVQSCPLLRLPLEILMHIINQADLVDGVLLAVSCKFMLRISQSCHLQVPNPVTHRATWHRKSLEQVQPICRCTLSIDILNRFRPRSSQGRPSRASTICIDCVRYRPTRKAYWLAVLAKMDTQGWGKDEGELWQSAVMWFSAGVKLQCPTCRMSEAELDDTIG